MNLQMAFVLTFSLSFPLTGIASQEVSQVGTVSKTVFADCLVSTVNSPNGVVDTQLKVIGSTADKDKTMVETEAKMVIGNSVRNIKRVIGTSEAGEKVAVYSDWPNSRLDVTLVGTKDPQIPFFLRFVDENGVDQNITCSTGSDFLEWIRK